LPAASGTDVLAGQRAPDGQPWPPNRGRYGERKRAAGLPIGVLTGTMLSEPELAGRRTITPDVASWAYGVTTFSFEKATWFSRGTSRGQPPRPFFALGEDDLDTLLDLSARRLERILRDLNR
jgi:hypothetical protein